MEFTAKRRSAPRVTVQQRSVDRCEAVLAEARNVLREEGLAGFSIPVLAERLGFPRASIYHFFPTPAAVLNELAMRGLQELERQLASEIGSLVGQDWRIQIRRCMHVVVRFYADNEIDRLLILGTAISDESYRATALTIRQLGDAARGLFAAAGIGMPLQPVDVVSLAVDLGTTCLRHSVMRHGRITTAYETAAVEAMVQCLAPHVQRATPS